MKIIRTVGNSNPAGITINPGFYALAATILTNMTADEALHTFCDLPRVAVGRRQAGNGKSELILQTAAEHPDLNNAEIGRLVGCSREMVRYVLKQKKRTHKVAGNDK